jgi:hypothetical protein
VSHFEERGLADLTRAGEELNAARRWFIKALSEPPMDLGRSGGDDSIDHG